MTELRYCCECGASLQPRLVGGQARGHRFCADCAEPRYQHPMIVVTCFVAHRDRLLWVQRGLQPQRGLWAIPGGFMESGESLAEGAARELREETGISLAPPQLQLYMTGAITFINQLYVAFRGTVESDAFEAGVESLACAFYNRSECPWEQLAYPEVNNCIEQAYDDLDSGDFGIWEAQMTPHRYQLLPVDIRA